MIPRDDHYTSIIERMVDHSFKLYRDSRGTREYPMRSARQLLTEIEVPSEQHDEVIRYIASRGFAYCLDPIIAHNGSRPERVVCVWGADQLHSRLTCVL